MRGYSFYAAILVVMAAIVICAAPASSAPADDAWDSFIAGAARFPLRCANTAVLDTETGLLWERSLTGSSGGAFDWLGAHDHCNTLVLCNRRGWRLPTVQELASLGGNPPFTFPQNPNPFNLPGVTGTKSWSATTSADNTANAWVVNFTGGLPSDVFNKGTLQHAWCVRFRQGVDPQ
jgi:Protein of unknown function (DUF1566)